MLGKRYLVTSLAVIIALVLSVVAVGGCAQPAAPTAPAAPEKIDVLVAGPPAEWGTYATAVAMADFVNRRTNLHLSVRAYGGPLSVLDAVVMGEADMTGMGADPVVAMAYEAYGDYEGKPPANFLRTIIGYMPLMETFLLPHGSDVQTVTDLRGKTSGRYLAESNIWQETMLEAYGVDIEDVIWVEVAEPDSALEEIRMGRLDSTWASTEGPDVMEASEALGGIIPLSIDPDKLEWMKENRPLIARGWVLYKIEPGYLPFLEIRGPTFVMTQIITQTTRKDVSEDIIYTYLKTLLDNMEEVSGLVGLLKDFGPQLIQRDFIVPYHEGAVKALKEANLWTDNMEQIQQELLAKE